jgi:hypothetical protein
MRIRVSGVTRANLGRVGKAERAHVTAFKPVGTLRLAHPTEVACTRSRICIKRGPISLMSRLPRKRM